jgi:hypothetical protein
MAAANVVRLSQDDLRLAIEARAQRELGASAQEVILATNSGRLIVPSKPETSRRVAALTRLLKDQKQS